jgi:hypothetical protein
MSVIRHVQPEPPPGRCRAEAIQFAFDGSAVPAEHAAAVGEAEVGVVLVEDANAFAFGKMRSGHRSSVLSRV